MITRRNLIASAGVASVLPASWGFATPPKKDRLVLGLTLEPPGLDPTTAAASSIAEVTLYNIYETLTAIRPDGSVAPMLAQRWDFSQDIKTCTFHLRRDVQFHNGRAFDAHTVKFALERAGAEQSVNKDRRTFAQLRVDVRDAHTVVIHNAEANPDLPFILGMSTAIMVEPHSAATNATQPVGTGPYQLAAWQKGAFVSLTAWTAHRDAVNLRIRDATFRFIPDAAAQTAALMAADIDVFPRAASRSVAQFRNHPQFQIVIADSLAKVVLSINHRRKPLDDVRVRRAILAAINRQDVIAAAADGLGKPIGSYYATSAPGYVDTTSLNPYDPAKARALLKEVGIKTPLRLGLVLPPADYARQGGEFIAAQLAQIGIQAQIQNVEWAQWLNNVYGKHQYDLSIVSHNEPLDLDNFIKPDYYWGYHSAQFERLFVQLQKTVDTQERLQLLAQIQRLLSEDAALGFLYQPQWASIARKGLRGIWPNLPIFVNALAQMAWE